MGLHAPLRIQAMLSKQLVKIRCLCMQRHFFKALNCFFSLHRWCTKLWDRGLEFEYGCPWRDLFDCPSPPFPSKHTYLFPYVKITAFRVSVGWENLTASAGLSVYQVERVSVFMHPSDCQLYSRFRLPERWGHCRSHFITLHWQYKLFCFPNITLRLIPDA